MYFSHHLIGIKLFPIFGFYISFQNNPFFYIIYIIFKVSILCSTTTSRTHVIAMPESKMPQKAECWQINFPFDYALSVAIKTFVI